MDIKDIEKNCDAMLRMLVVDYPAEYKRVDVVFFNNGEKGTGVILDYEEGIKQKELEILYPNLKECYKKDGYFLLRGFGKKKNFVSTQKTFPVFNEDGSFKEWQFQFV